MNMNKERFLAENQVLASKVPSSAYRFIGIGTSSPYLRIAARTNNGHIYTLHFDLRGFPESSPKVFVTKMLKDKSCNDMSGASGSMHTLCSERLDTDLPLRTDCLDTLRFSFQGVREMLPVAEYVRAASLDRNADRVLS